MTRKFEVDQQHAGLVGVADAHALHDGAGLRLPVEMDREHADRRAVGLAAGAHAGAIGRDLRIAEQRLVLDVAGDIVVAGAQSLRLAKPFGVGDVLADRAKPVGAAVGDDVAVEVAEPEIEIDGVGAEDHAQALRCVGDGGRRSERPRSRPRRNWSPTSARRRCAHRGCGRSARLRSATNRPCARRASAGSCARSRRRDRRCVWSAGFRARVRWSRPAGRRRAPPAPPRRSLRLAHRRASSRSARSAPASSSGW